MGLKHFLLAASASTALVLAAGTAQAGPVRHGWYFGLEAGWSATGDTSLPAAGFTDLQFENGRGYFFTLGHAFDGNWRLELEGGYRENDLEKVNFLPASDGKLKEYSGFLNIRKDIPISNRWLIDIGAGVGLDNARFKDTLGHKDGDTVLAGQALVGLTYRLSDHWDISATYRYLMTLQDVELLLPTHLPDSMDLHKHTVTLGLRYGYDDPPAPPPPPAPPAPPAPPPMAEELHHFLRLQQVQHHGRS